MIYLPFGSYLDDYVPPYYMPVQKLCLVVGRPIPTIRMSWPVTSMAIGKLIHLSQNQSDTSQFILALLNPIPSAPNVAHLHPCLNTTVVCTYLPCLSFTWTCARRLIDRTLSKSLKTRLLHTVDNVLRQFHSVH